MDSWIIWASQLIITLLIGAITFFLKRTLDKFEAGMKQQSTQLEQMDAKHTKEAADLRKELSDLKADLPLVYVLREEFLRVMNNVDAKLDKLLYRTGGSNSE